MKFDVTATSKMRVYLGTIVATALAVVVSLLADFYNLNALGSIYEARSLEIAILIPLIIAPPISYCILEAFRRGAILREELQRVASTDNLTQVLNRGAFSMLVNAYLEEAKRHAAMQYGSMLVIDADHFKKINDTHGHPTGDAALKVLARTISQNIRSADLVGRIGGEEFCVFLPATTRSEAEMIAERIRETITRIPIASEAGEIALSVSVGAVDFRGQVTYEQIFAAADRYVYEAKARGRNRVVFGSLMMPA